MYLWRPGGCSWAVFAGLRTPSLTGARSASPAGRQPRSQRGCLQSVKIKKNKRAEWNNESDKGALEGGQLMFTLITVHGNYFWAWLSFYSAGHGCEVLCVCVTAASLTAWLITVNPARGATFSDTKKETRSCRNMQISVQRAKENIKHNLILLNDSDFWSSVFALCSRKEFNHGWPLVWYTWHPSVPLFLLGYVTFLTLFSAFDGQSLTQICRHLHGMMPLSM